MKTILKTLLFILTVQVGLVFALQLYAHAEIWIWSFWAGRAIPNPNSQDMNVPGEARQEFSPHIGEAPLPFTLRDVDGNEFHFGEIKKPTLLCFVSWSCLCTTDGQPDRLSNQISALLAARDQELEKLKVLLAAKAQKYEIVVVYVSEAHGPDPNQTYEQRRLLAKLASDYFHVTVLVDNMGDDNVQDHYHCSLFDTMFGLDTIFVFGPDGTLVSKTVVPGVEALMAALADNR